MKKRLILSKYEHENEKRTLELQITRIELKLKILGLWTAGIGILGTVAGILLSIFSILTWQNQNRLSELEITQKQSVRISLKFIVQRRRSGQIFIVPTFKNDSGRAVSIGML